MKKKTSSHRHQHFVAAFAISAFALLGTLTMQQQAANAAAASVLDHANVMTTYSNVKNCIRVVHQTGSQNNFRVCRPVK